MMRSSRRREMEVGAVISINYLQHCFTVWKTIGSESETLMDTKIKSLRLQEGNHDNHLSVVPRWEPKYLFSQIRVSKDAPLIEFGWIARHI